jgi:Fe-S oxidoreductase
LRKARNYAQRVINTIKRIDPVGELPVIGSEPSEVYTLKDEYLDFFPDDEYVKNLATRTFMIDEYLLSLGKGDIPDKLRIVDWKHDENQLPEKVLVHGHCYQKAQLPREDGYPSGVQATRELLERAGYQVEVIDSGCCGMAGAFGYEANHYEISMSIGRLSLFPAVNSADPDTILAASGFSCLTQIKDGTGRKAVHPITLISRRLKE